MKVWFLLAAPLLFHPIQDDDLKDRVRELVDRLGSDNIADREDAAEELASLGAAAVPILRSLKPGDEEVGQRLAEILDTIELDALRKRVLGAPTLFSVEAKEESARAILARLSKAGGTPIVVPPGFDEKITLRLKESTFWESLDRICRTAKKLMYVIDEESIRIENRPYRDLPKQFRGRFFVYVNEIQFDTHRMSGGATSRLTRVDLFLAWEKGTDPGRPVSRVEEFVDDTGKSLIANPGGMGGGFVFEAGGMQTPLSKNAIRRPLPFNGSIHPDEAATKIASFKGEITSKFILRFHSAEFDALKRGAKVDIKNVAMELRAYKSNETAAVASVRYTAQGRDKDTQLRPESLVLVDEDGKTWVGVPQASHHAVFVEGQRTRNVQAVFRFPKGTKVKSLRVRVPRDTHVETFPFHIKDLSIQ